MAQVSESHQVQQNPLESSRETAKGGCQGKEVGHCFQQPRRKLPQVDLCLQESLLQGLQETRGPVGLGGLGEEILEQPKAAMIAFIFS